ncbi:hypothetical protein Sjap_013277 [Stephania japonica]|uniref:Uncharacterized protein n=1 Tax=Stephania japonica TaxID=461633 RepID=A0AAP0IYT5_9MAGN
MIASLNASATENVEKASNDEVSGSNEEMSGGAPTSAGMMSSEALPVEGTLENKEDEIHKLVMEKRKYLVTTSKLLSEPAPLLLLRRFF